MKSKIKNFIIDADGVFTDGTFYYSEKGKVLKKYGPDDADALSLIRDKLNIHVITADKRGFSITKKRIHNHMKLSLELVSSFERVDWISKKYKLSETIYMGDGIFDMLVFKEVAYSIAPANALSAVKKKADFVTERRGGEGAVAEAVIHILSTFFNMRFTENLIGDVKESGAWKRNETH